MLVDILLSSDRNQYVGMFAVINSIAKNTRNVNNIRFHLLIKEGEYKECNNLVKKHFPTYNINIKEFSSQFLKKNIKVTRHGNPEYVNRVSNLLNFSRFYFGTIYQDLNKVIYLDTDMIVQGDICELYNTALQDDKYILGAVKVSSYSKWKGFNTMAKEFKHIDFKKDSFNAGMLVINLNKWREEKIQDKLEHWMLLHKNNVYKEGLFTYGTQPLLNLVFYNNFEKIDPKWNFYRLGHGNETAPDELIKKMKILHWAGSRKPWLRSGYYKQYWQKYKVV